VFLFSSDLDGRASWHLVACSGELWVAWAWLETHRRAKRLVKDQ